MFRSSLTASLIISGLLTLAGAAHCEEASTLSPDLKINALQVLGTHNSYAKPVDKRVLGLVAPVISKLMATMGTQMKPEQMALFKEEHPNGLDFNESLNYDHPGLKEQLDLGVRGPEIDINPDPDGGHYLDPAAYRLLREKGVKDLLPIDQTDMEKPGFKVFHITDIDVRSSCTTLKLCLRQIKDWSDAHPGHVPLYIMLEAKTQALPILPGATSAIAFTPRLFDDLDKELIDGLGRDRIITPDDVRGTYPTLNAAIRADNWPKLKDARGKVVILMLTANGPTGGEAYLEGHAGLKGRVAFLRSEPGEDHGAFLLLDNALMRYDDIKKYVQQGYLVRTRSDIETYEAKVNDKTRSIAAFNSGAQIVSTDFEKPGNAYGTDFVVKLPGGGVARCNQVVSGQCAKK
jgi:hypothetical protein